MVLFDGLTYHLRRFSLSAVCYTTPIEIRCHFAHFAHSHRSPLRFAPCALAAPPPPRMRVRACVPATLLRARVINPPITIHREYITSLAGVS